LFVLWHSIRVPWVLYLKLDEADHLKRIWGLLGLVFLAGTFGLLLYTAAWFYTTQPKVNFLLKPSRYIPTVHIGSGSYLLHFLNSFHFRWSVGMLQFDENRRGNQNASIDFREDFRMPEADKVIERTGIGDNDHAEGYRPFAARTRFSVAISLSRSSTV
jgi:hypothetical protein